MVRWGLAAAFSTAFVVAAVAIFAVASIGAHALGVTLLPLHWRLALAGAGLVLLAAADLRALSRSSYCPIGWRRQTPRVLLRRYHMFVVATLWGLDTGLVVTTFRVAAVSWAALYIAALGLAPGWTGLAYGLGFTSPFLVLLFRPNLGVAAKSPTPTDPGLERMLRMRSLAQACSAALLIASGGLLIGTLID
jgi:hypothetical protein